VTFSAGASPGFRLKDVSFVSTNLWLDRTRFSTIFDACPIPADPGARDITQRGSYQVMSDVGELTAQIAGKFALEAMPAIIPSLAIGSRSRRAPMRTRDDPSRSAARELFQAQGGAAHGAAGAEQVCRRQSQYRAAGAIPERHLNPQRMERYLFVARDGGAEPVIVLTKADACDDVEAARASIESIAAGARIYVVSALTAPAWRFSRRCWRQAKTAALLGSSALANRRWSMRLPAPK